MGEMENQAEFFYEKLKNQANPGLVLIEFYAEVTKLPTGRSEIIMINRLIKLFGRFTVYFAIMDLVRYDGKLTGQVFPLLYTICRSRFERAHDTVFSASHESLDKQLNQLEKELEKSKKAKGKFPSPEGLDLDGRK